MKTVLETYFRGLVVVFSSATLKRMNFSDDVMASNSTTKVRQVTVFGLTTFLLVAIVILPIGIAGNILVIIVVKKKRYLHTKTNFLLANLAVFDLMANVLAYTVGAVRAFPIQARTFGKFLCKINSFYPAISLCSILTLTVIALERYNAIVKPLSTGLKFEKKTLRYFIIAIWILALAAATPLIHFAEYNSDYRCDRTWSTTTRFVFWTSAFIAIIGIPLIIIIFCYGHIIRTLYFQHQVVPMNIPREVDEREKKRVVKLSIVVTSVFIFSFIPFAIVRELEFGGPVPNAVSVFALCSVLLSSVLNPFIYAYQSTNYRRAFKETILSCR